MHSAERQRIECLRHAFRGKTKQSRVVTATISPLPLRRVGVVVPSLELGGGVPSVAEFVCETIERSGMSEIRLVSLASAARDPLGVALTRPKSWIRGVRTEA